MSFSAKRRILLLSWAILCAAVISCEPEGAPTTREKPPSGAAEGRVETAKKTLSREQIIAAANAAVRRHGEDPEKYDVVYDEGNAIWMATARRLPSMPDTLKRRLEGHDYQVVIYGLRSRGVGGVIDVFIDRNTGEELWFAH